MYMRKFNINDTGHTSGVSKTELVHRIWKIFKITYILVYIFSSNCEMGVEISGS